MRNDRYSTGTKAVVRSLLVMVVVLFASINWTFAQTTVTIGTGTSTSTAGTNGDPIYRSSTTSSFHHSKSIQLLTASQISAAGIPSGANITQWGYNKVSTGNPSGSNSWTINVYLKNSSAEEFFRYTLIVQELLPDGFPVLTLLYPHWVMFAPLGIPAALI